MYLLSRTEYQPKYWFTKHIEQRIHSHNQAYEQSFYISKFQNNL